MSLYDLPPELVCLIAFETGIHICFGAITQATATAKAQATNWIYNMSATG